MDLHNGFLDKMGLTSLEKTQIINRTHSEFKNLDRNVILVGWKPYA